MKTKKIILSLLFIVFFKIMGFATHGGVGEFHITLLDSNTRLYKITYDYYSDCYGIGNGSSVQCDITYSNGCPSTILILNLQSITVEHTKCEPVLTQCETSTSLIPGYKLYRYQGNVTFPPNCGIANIVYNTCCISGSINTLDPTSPLNYLSEVMINTNLKRGNNSPIILNPTLIKRLCAGTNYRDLFQLSDSENDSIRYEIAATLVGANGSSVIYRAPYSAAKPLAISEAGISIQQNQGIISYTPLTPNEVTIYDVNIYEYRKLKKANGGDSIVFAGFKTRSFIARVEANCNLNESYKGVLPENLGVLNVFSQNTLEVCADSSEFTYLIVANSDKKLSFNSLGKANSPLKFISSIVTKDVVNNKDSLFIKLKIYKKDLTSNVSTNYFVVNHCQQGIIQTKLYEFNIKLRDPMYCPCIAIPSSNSGPIISNVSVDKINNNSTCNTTGQSGSVQNVYGDYTHLNPPILLYNTSYTFTLKSDKCKIDTPSKFYVFLDKNKNNLFDNSELIYQSANFFNVSTTKVESFNFFVPFNFALGKLRMRVIVADTPTNGCIPYRYGETEDYMVEVQDSSYLRFGCVGVNANFSEITVGSSVFFTNLSTAPNSGLTYHWDFGDATYSTTKNPTKTYTNKGKYTVRLIINSNLGNAFVICRDTFIDTAETFIDNPCNMLQSNFKLTRQGLNTTLTNQSNLGNLINPVYTWNFGDGTFSTQPNPNHLYTANGYYYISLNILAYDTVERKYCSKTIEKGFNINSNPCGNFKADFTFSRGNNLQVQFSNMTLLGSNQTSKWAFGFNNDTSILNHPTYTYLSEGAYLVKLTTKATFDGQDCIDSIKKIAYIINGPCPASFYTGPMPCPKYINPVCGCNNKTYINACEAQRNGILAYTSGPCPGDTIYTKLVGSVFYDANNNCNYDNLEYHSNNEVQIKIQNNTTQEIFYTSPNHLGFYSLYLVKGNYSIKTNNIGDTSSNLNCSNFFTNINLLPNTINVKNLPIDIGNCKYSKIVSFFRNSTRPMSLSNLYVDINLNYKAPNVTPQIKIIVKSGLSGSLLSQSSIPDTSKLNLFYYLKNNPGNRILININQLIPNLAVNSVIRDTIIILYDTFSCSSTDTIYINNVVRAPYDPNDKQAFPSGIGPKGLTDINTKKLIYKIRFQNVGNAPAQNIIISDTITELLKMETISEVLSSHPYNMFYSDASRRLIVEYSNIWLPDSASDPEGSQGFIQFTIYLKDSLPLGTEIKNNADIYFDYNEPVRTNTKLNTLFEFKDTASASIPTILTNWRMIVFPNPTSNQITIKWEKLESQNVHFTLLDPTGRTILTRNEHIENTSGSVVWNINEIPVGCYILKVSNSDNKDIQQFKIMKQ